jgi:hypothetical protein
MPGRIGVKLHPEKTHGVREEEGFEFEIIV